MPRKPVLAGIFMKKERIMDNATVCLSACNEYNVDRIESILRAHFDKINLREKITPGMKIALKLNLVSAMKPDLAGTTHPSVIEALCRILIDYGAKVIMGDSPGGPFTGVYLKGVYNICGIADVSERTGAELNNDFSQKDIVFENGVIARNMTVTNWLLEADAIINVCKLKTHGMMAMSAAVKNMFGSIPGTMKPEYHFRFPKQDDFANMLIDIQEYWRPKMLLHVVDGIVGMEGNGPTAGTPRSIGVILTSPNPYSLDLVGGRIIGLGCDEVLTMSEAYKRELGPDNADKVLISEVDKEYLGTEDNLKPYMISDYKLLDTKADLQFGGDSFIKRLRGKFISKVLSSRPDVCKEECIGCRKCEQICPAKAITMVDNKPVIDRNKCIKCFCCQEFCPKGAMKVKRTLIAKILAH